MAIQLLPPLARSATAEDLTSKYLSPQRSRFERVKNAITSAEGEIERVRKTAAPSSRDADTAALYSAAHKKQQITQIHEIRNRTLDEVRTTLQDMLRASEEAAMAKERHWDLRSILRRAKPNGLNTATALRADYMVVLKHAGHTELAAYAQQALDDMDPLLMDVVLKVNDQRRTADRSFVSATALEMFAAQYTEYQLAVATLDEVTRLFNNARLMQHEFGTGRADGIGRISVGLSLANGDYMLDEAGGVVLADKANRPKDNAIMIGRKK
jgi:hypothetical protein